MSKKLSIKDLNLSGKKALIRVDFNVPMEKGVITDDTRIRSSLPTIRYVLDQGGVIILMSHLERPGGKKDPLLTLKPCGEALSRLLKREVKFASDCIGPEVEQIVSTLIPGDILLLENLRFHKGEEDPRGDPTFASALAELGDLYINDAFGSSHRSNSSLTIVPSFFPGKAAAGFGLEKEIAYLGSVLSEPKRPFYAILGGGKVSTKFKVIESLMRQADLLLIGGGMAFNFLKSEKISIGSSLFEPDFLAVARQILDVSSQSRCRIVLPVDFVIAREISSETDWRIVKAEEGIPDGWKGVDIGPETIKLYSRELQKGATIFWNGPMGIFECPPFDKGTVAIAKVLAGLSATTIIGGGDSIAAIERAGLADQMSHLSTGGGASLEFLEFGTLPGIEALSNAL